MRDIQNVAIGNEKTKLHRLRREQLTPYDDFVQFKHQSVVEITTLIGQKVLITFHKTI